MQFTTNKEKLLKAVSLASHLTTTRATLPILQNIYLSVIKNTLLIRATDLDQTIEVIVEGLSSEPGQTTTPSRLLLDYLQNNSDNEVTLETTDTELLVKSLNHQAKLKGLSAEEYPTIPEVKAAKSVEIDSLKLKEAITKTIFASAADDTRPILNSLLWRFKENSITLVGTDGYRLAHYVFNEGAKGIESDIIIPKKTMQELIKILDSGKVKIDFAASQVRFSINNISLISRVLDGAFPAFEGIIPKKHDLLISVDSTKLGQSLRLSSLFSRDSAYSTALKLDKDQLTISAVSPHLGESSNVVSLAEAVKEPFTISLNAQYLLEALNQITGEVRLKFTDSKSPVVVEDPTSPKYLYLLMPLRSN